MGDPNHPLPDTREPPKPAPPPEPGDEPHAVPPRPTPKQQPPPVAALHGRRRVALFH